jgi:hypothetical protein
LFVHSPAFFQILHESLASIHVSDGLSVGTGLIVSLKVALDGASERSSSKVSFNDVGAGEIENDGEGEIDSLNDVGDGDSVEFKGVWDGDSEPRRLVGVKAAVGVIVGTMLPTRLGLAVIFKDEGISSANSRMVESVLDLLYASSNRPSRMAFSISSVNCLVTMPSPVTTVISMSISRQRNPSSTNISEGQPKN